MENFNKLKELVSGMEADAEKFYEKGNGAAGTRVRKALMEIKKLAGEMRKEVAEKKRG